VNVVRKPELTCGGDRRYLFVGYIAVAACSVIIDCVPTTLGMLEPTEYQASTSQGQYSFRRTRPIGFDLCRLPAISNRQMHGT